MSFRGRNDHSIDSKGRIAIPAKMRATMPEDWGGTFVAYFGRDRGIKLYPLYQWRRLEAEIEQLKQFRLDVLELSRRFFSETEDLDVDGQWRVTLSKSLLEHAGLAPGGMARVIGAGDRMEIWRADLLDEHLSHPERSTEALVSRSFTGA